MQFSNPTKKNGILQKCELYIFGGDYGAITNNTTNLAVFTSLANDALDSIASDILDTDTRWQWDDTNYTDFPIGMLDLVDGQRDYTLDVSHLKILRVEAKDISGNYYPLIPIDNQDLRDRGISPTEFLETNGLPQYYDKIANSIMLYPQPATDQVTIANGLKVEFQRGAEYYETTDTDKEAGFVSLYHKLIPLMASYDYAVSNEMTNKANFLLGKIEQERAKLRRFITKREKDERSFISMRVKPSK